MKEMHSIESFEDFKRLTSEEERFFIFMRLEKIDHIYEKFESLDKKYAPKWVQYPVQGVIALILTGFIGALLSLVVTGTQ